MTVAAIMSTPVTTVRADLRVYDLICLLVDQNFSGAPVVDQDGRAIGMVSKSDLIWEDHDWAELRQELIAWKRIAGPRVAADTELFDERNLASLTVADVMTTGSLSVIPTTSIQEASRLMISHHIHRLSIVDESNQLVGIVTTFDITRWVAQAQWRYLPVGGPALLAP